MLIITRKIGQSIIINGETEILLYRASSGYARIGINAPKEVRVNRKEIEDLYLMNLADQAKNTNLNIMK